MSTPSIQNTSAAALPYSPESGVIEELHKSVKQRHFACRFLGIYPCERLRNGFSIAHVFDGALGIERAGNKPLADEIRRAAIDCVSTSPTQPKVDDPHFLTPPLTGEFSVGVRSFCLEDASRNERDMGHLIDSTRRLEIDVYYPGVGSQEHGFRVQPFIIDDGFSDPVLLPQLQNSWTRSQPPDSLPLLKQSFPLFFFPTVLGAALKMIIPTLLKSLQVKDTMLLRSTIHMQMHLPSFRPCAGLSREKRDWRFVSKR